VIAFVRKTGDRRQGRNPYFFKYQWYQKIKQCRKEVCHVQDFPAFDPDDVPAGLCAGSCQKTDANGGVQSEPDKNRATVAL